MDTDGHGFFLEGGSAFLITIQLRVGVICCLQGFVFDFGTDRQDACPYKRSSAFVAPASRRRGSVRCRRDARTTKGRAPLRDQQPARGEVVPEEALSINVLTPQRSAIVVAGFQPAIPLFRMGLSLEATQDSSGPTPRVMTD